MCFKGIHRLSSPLLLIPYPVYPTVACFPCSAGAAGSLGGHNRLLSMGSSGCYSTLVTHCVSTAHPLRDSMWFPAHTSINSEKIRLHYASAKALHPHISDFATLQQVGKNSSAWPLKLYLACLPRLLRLLCRLSFGLARMICQVGK